jgi:SAM-dependent methyltransferase
MPSGSVEGRTTEAGDRRLHPLVAGFLDAETYDRGRPRYGQDVAEALIAGLDLAAGAPLLELGAGTGSLARALLAGGLEVTALEPLEGMRRVLARAIGSERVLDGVAEQIPLADGSVEAVVAADAFHWFDEARAMPEIRRVLRPRGGMAILRTLPVLDAPWSRELGELFVRELGEHPAVSERGAAAALEADGAFGPVSERLVSYEQVTDRARILDYVASFSWVGALPAEGRRQLLAEAEELLRRHGVGELRHEFQVRIWMARRR